MLKKKMEGKSLTHLQHNFLKRKVMTTAKKIFIKKICNKVKE
jgi:hypothetical protein